MINKFKKMFSVLIALSFILCAVSSASAKGIVTLRTFWDEASQTYKIGSKADFLGHNWTLWKADDTYLYVITTDSLRKSIFSNDEVVYADSEVRRVVNGYENEMKNYSGGGNSATDTLTWSIINGGDANYIANSPTTEDGVGTDHLYLLSYSDAHFLKDSADPDKNAICKTGYNWWLRTARRSGSALRIYNIYSDGKLIDDHAWFTRGVRPALKINLASPMLSAVRF
ncbi:MAG: DUF6273 domain-containing protein [Synergistes sp.]|nr:DUF6273 domain-containing protein [Synergistes sp.]